MKLYRLSWKIFLKIERMDVQLKRLDKHRLGDFDALRGRLCRHCCYCHGYEEWFQLPLFEKPNIQSLAFELSIDLNFRLPYATQSQSKRYWDDREIKMRHVKRTNKDSWDYFSVLHNMDGLMREADERRFGEFNWRNPLPNWSFST